MEIAGLIEKVQKIFAENGGGFKTQEEVSRMNVGELFEFLVNNGLEDISPKSKVELVVTSAPIDQIIMPLVLPTGHTLDYLLEEEVFLRTDVSQRERLVSEIILLPQNAVMYRLSCETAVSTHYPFEIDFERDIVKATGG